MEPCTLLDSPVQYILLTMLQVAQAHTPEGTPGGCSLDPEVLFFLGPLLAKCRAGVW